MFINSQYSFSDGLECSRNLLKRFPKVDGILASTDMVALSLYKVLCEQGRRVPDEIVIVGYDGLELSELMTPSLTTVEQPIEQIGRFAAKIIIDQVAGKEIVQRENVLPVSLKIRQTTKPKTT